MTPQRWARIREVFGAALETPETERPEFLDSACRGEADLRLEVERMLQGNEQPSWPSPTAALLSLSSELAPGDTLAQYRVDAKLGEGGMGVVYKAYDTRLQRHVALKVLPLEHAADPDHRQRLLREARAVSALNHPNIVTIYEIGSEGNIDFIAMEYVQGQPLAQAIPAQGLPLSLAIGNALEICAALASAHAAGIIHRDLKPANIMLTNRGHVKLLDFGIAQQGSLDESQTARTPGGEIAGTVGYISPEQARGLSANQQSDLFSLGVVLYEMVTGERAFAGKPAMEVCDAILHTAPREFDAPVPTKLKELILRLLEKNPANRYASADEVHRELGRLEASLAPKTPMRLSRMAWITVGAVVILIGVSRWLAVGYVGARSLGARHGSPRDQPTPRLGRVR